MQFHLIYEGRLRSNGDPRHKLEIRRALHPQLKELWTHPPLAGNDEWLVVPAPENGLSVVREVGAFSFAPLVCEPLKLWAELRIVMLRPAPPGALIGQRGDIDNQLKTLFDALRCPQSAQELPAGEVPSEGEVPLYCLLDDDERIVDLRVSVDRYLAAPTADSVRVSMFVKTRPSAVVHANLPLG